MNQYPLVYLDHVTKNYGHEVALMDVSLNIQPGRIIGLLGPNGRGKTTIIKLINGLLQPKPWKYLYSWSITIPSF